jgi:hypothetical protein
MTHEDGIALPAHDGHAHGHGLARRIEDKDGRVGTALYHDMLALQERNRQAPDEVEVDEPASIFDHARAALRKLSHHAADDFAHGVLEALPYDPFEEIDPIGAPEMLGADEVAWQDSAA